MRPAGHHQAITLDDSQAGLHALLGTLLADSAQDDAAVVEFQQARKLDPKLADDFNDAASPMGQASRAPSPDLANTFMHDACWLISVATHLDVPAGADHPTPPQHCPPN